MSTFEEQFPSLTAENKKFHIFDWKMIEKFCLDKQKVREAIERLKRKNIKSSLPIKDIVVHNILDELSKELGL